ncbi:MAG: hypothetical protein ACLFQS_06985 [Bacteroidales bacterium]
MEKNSGSSYNSSTSGNRKKSAASGVVVFLSILALLLGIAGAILLRETLSARYEIQMSERQVRQATAEKQDLLYQLDEIENRYNELTKEYEELNDLFLAEKRKVGQLRAQLRNSGIGDEDSSEDISGFRERIAELENQLESYRTQLEMVEAENEALTGENAQIRNTLSETTDRNRQLETINEDLEKKLEDATILTVSEIKATPLREKRKGDEPTEKAKKTDKISICFTINQNLVANPGNRDFYVRLTDPSNQVMSLSPDNTIEFEGETIQYSVLRTVNFQNNAQEVCVVWDQEEKFAKGYYNVVIFNDGNEVGYKLFQLD